MPPRATDRTPIVCECPRARHEHGKYTTYRVHGCRCDDCSAANTVYNLSLPSYRSKLKSGPNFKPKPKSKSNSGEKTVNLGRGDYPVDEVLVQRVIDGWPSRANPSERREISRRLREQGVGTAAIRRLLMSLPVADEEAGW